VSELLGLSVACEQVRAVLLSRAKDRIDWAGAAEWQTTDELSDAIARLAAETGRRVGRTRVVLERSVIQARTLDPAPKLGPVAARRYVALEAPRLFRKNGVPLVTDAALVDVDGTRKALWAVAVAEPVLQAVLKGCSAAGLIVEGVGPASEVLPRVAESNGNAELAFPNSASAEVITTGRGGTWRSRIVPVSPIAPPAWVAPLMALGGESAHFAPAFAAASCPSQFCLLPEDARAAQALRQRRQLIRLFTFAVLLWIIAVVTYAVRLSTLAIAAQHELSATAAAVDSGLSERRDLAAGRATLAVFGNAERTRSHQLALLAAVTAALGDSTYLIAFRVGEDSVLHLAGFSPSAVRVVANLGRLSLLREVRLEAPVTREQAAGSREQERFAIAAKVVSP
jgi:hypothetical protein